MGAGATPKSPLWPVRPKRRRRQQRPRSGALRPKVLGAQRLPVLGALFRGEAHGAYRAYAVRVAAADRAVFAPSAAVFVAVQYGTIAARSAHGPFSV